MNAMLDIKNRLEWDEEVEYIIFGEWGWGGNFGEGGLAFGEPSPPPVPFEKRNVLMTPEQAEPFMKGWSFLGEFGAPKCYAVYIWTNKRVGWVSQYDGATLLDFAPRHPTDGEIPEMSGGG